MMHLLSTLLSLSTLSTALPQGSGPPPGVSPTMQSMSMSGPGCPAGASGTAQHLVDGRPVFLFPEWNLALPEKAGPVTTAANEDSKWCTESIQLVNGPVGMQLRIASITVGGWASLDEGSKLRLDVETSLGEKVAGNQTATLGGADLKGGNFTVPLATQPTDIWSACVGADGIVPALVIRTGVTLIGSSAASVGAVGSADKTELAKALSIFFTPAWRPCA
ncbi:protein of unknown function (DUF4360) domain containing protein [Rhypophila decipiens]